MRLTWRVTLAVFIAILLFAALVVLLVCIPSLAAPVESAAVVLGTAFTAYAAYSAWKAAQVSRDTTRGVLRRELANLRAERVRLEADTKRDTHWHQVESSYSPGSEREAALRANLAEQSARSAEVEARIAELESELG